MRMTDFARFFRDEAREAEILAAQSAREILEWMGQAYHKKFDQWLEQEASKPLDASEPHMELVQAAVRANTLKEVRQHLSRLHASAVAAMERAKEVQDAG